jgi:hypothetical protein
MRTHSVFLACYRQRDEYSEANGHAFALKRSVISLIQRKIHWNFLLKEWILDTIPLLTPQGLRHPTRQKELDSVTISATNSEQLISNVYCNSHYHIKWAGKANCNSQCHHANRLSFSSQVFNIGLIVALTPNTKSWSNNNQGIALKTKLPTPTQRSAQFKVQINGYELWHETILSVI